MNKDSMSLEFRGFQKKLNNVRVISTDKTLKKRLLRPGAEIVQQGLIEAAPHGKKVHKRYKTAKLTKGLRAPKGRGRVVATYFPGNLQHSVSILNFNKSDRLHVGAKLNKGDPHGDFGHAFGKSDGYYLHMVENKHPFWVRKVDQIKERALAANVEKLDKWINKQTKI